MIVRCIFCLVIFDLWSTTLCSMSVMESYEKHLNELQQPMVSSGGGPMRVKRYKCVEEYVDLPSSSTAESFAILNSPPAVESDHGQNVFGPRWSKNEPTAPPTVKPDYVFIRPSAEKTEAVTTNNVEISVHSRPIMSAAPIRTPIFQLPPPNLGQPMPPSHPFVQLPPMNAIASARPMPPARQPSEPVVDKPTKNKSSGPRRPTQIISSSPIDYSRRRISPTPFPPLPNFGSAPMFSLTRDGAVFQANIDDPLQSNDIEDISVVPLNTINPASGPRAIMRSAKNREMSMLNSNNSDDIHEFVSYNAKAFRNAFSRNNTFPKSTEISSDNTGKMWTFSAWKAEEI